MEVQGKHQTKLKCPARLHTDMEQNLKKWVNPSHNHMATEQETELVEFKNNIKEDAKNNPLEKPQNILANNLAKMSEAARHELGDINNHARDIHNHRTGGAAGSANPKERTGWPVPDELRRLAP